MLTIPTLASESTRLISRIPWKCAAELEALAESLASESPSDADRLRAFARQIRADGCRSASPCEGCSGGYRLEDLMTADPEQAAARQGVEGKGLTASTDNGAHQPGCPLTCVA